MENKELKELKFETPSEFGEIKIPEQKRIEDCEWCFQFDNDEPQVFAWTDEPSINKDEDPKVIFTITNLENSYISFTHENGKTFRIFARQISNEGKQKRQEQKELIKQSEYASENKETQS